MKETELLIRDIKISIIEGKYKCIQSYVIPENIEKWLNCPNCGLKPLVWNFNNGSSTACGCGKSIYDHHSICAESIMSYINRHKGSAIGYDNDKLRKNWNHWVETNEELEPRKWLIENGMW